MRPPWEDPFDPKDPDFHPPATAEDAEEMENAWPKFTAEQKETVIDNALRYAGCGWHVFPCDPREGKHKTPLIKWGRGATNDQQEVRRLFSHYPGAHIGVACKPSGLVCLDQDNKKGKNGVADTLKLLDSDYGTRCRSQTPSGGQHAIYTADDQFVVRTRANCLAPGIDVRAAGGDYGGYFVAPNGIDQRRWLDGPPWEAAPSPMPPRLLELLKARENRAKPSGSVSGQKAVTDSRTKRSPATLAAREQGGHDEIHEQVAREPCGEQLLARVQRALSFIPAEERDVWRDTIFATHAACHGSDDGIPLVREFSNRAKRRPEVSDPDDAERIYRKAVLPDAVNQDGRSANITAARLWALAYLCGGDEELWSVTFESLQSAANTYRHDLAADGIDVDKRLADWEDLRSADAVRGFAADPLPPGSQEVLRDRNSIQLLTVDELAARPRTHDLWARALPEGGLAIWYGAPKCGKSYLGLGLGLAIAEGKPFLGKATRQGTVIYIAGEGINGIVDKVAAAIGPERARDGSDPIHRAFYVLAGMPNLTDPGAMQRILLAIRELGVKPALVIIDTMARAIGAGGLDENSTKDMARMVAALDHLREQTTAAVLGMHHAGKSGTDRGSSALRGAADVFAKVERVRPRVSKFVVEDMRDGDPGAPIEITWEERDVDEDEHGPVSRLFASSFREASGGATEETDPQGTNEVLAFIQERQRCSRRDIELTLEMTTKEVRGRLDRLRKEGKIQREGFGRDTTYVASCPFPALGKAEGAKRATP